jgi:hypothetical protein
MPEPELNLDKEYRRWQRWKWLSWLGRVLKIGTVLRTDSGDWPSDTGEPPMVELARMAKDGHAGPSPRGKFEPAAIQRAVTIMAAVTRMNGAITEPECELAAKFIAENAPDKMTAEEQAGLLDHFRNDTLTYMQLRNEIYLLTKQIAPLQAKRLTEALFRLANSGGLETKAERDIADLVERLGMSHTDIRLIQSGVRRESGLGKPATGVGSPPPTT